MKHIIRFLLPIFALLIALVDAPAAPVDSVPATIDYQGKVFDQAGAVLAPSSPANYTMQFRIYDALTGGTAVWAESQLVTVDKGQFSVRLGEGTAIAGLPRPGLPSVFEKTPRFLGVSVEITGQTPGEITPRLAFLATPFAFTAERAKLADSATTAAVATNVLQTAGTAAFSNATFTQANATTLGATTVNATGVVTANAFIGKGSSLTELDASKITSGTLADARLPSEVVRTVKSQNFSGVNNFQSSQNIFNGNGAGLTSLNAANLTSGIIPDARLSSKVVLGSMNDNLFLLRASNDGYHGLVYGLSGATVSTTDATSTNTASTMWGNDGPVLFANGQGILGNVTLTSGQPTGNKALDWSTTRVSVYRNLQLSNDITIKKPPYSSSWRFYQGQIGNNDNNAGNELRLGCSTDGSFPSSTPYRWWQKDGASSFSSDRRIKKDITYIGPVLDSVLQLRPASFRFKVADSSSPKLVGFIAQEVQPVFPDSVSTHDGILALSYEDFGVYSVKAIQELAAETRSQSAAAAAEIKKLQNENATLRGSLSDLERRLNALEAGVK